MPPETLGSAKPKASNASTEADKALTNIPNLPPEIVSCICENACRSVLQKLRLVSKQMNEYAEPELFRCITLRVSRMSFDKLKEISTSERLRQYVHVLEYDGRLLPWEALDYEDFYGLLNSRYGWEPICSKSMTTSKRTCRGPAGMEYADEPSSHLYDSFLILLADQKELHRGEAEVEMLTEAFKRLPNLDTLCLETGLRRERTLVPFPEHMTCPGSELEPTWDEALENLEPISDSAHRTGIERGLRKPSFFGSIRTTASAEGVEDGDEGLLYSRPTRKNFHVKRLLALIEAAQRSERQINNLSAGWMDPHLVLEKIELPGSSSLNAFVDNLTTLSFRFADWGCLPKAWEHTASLIALATHLQSLSIVGNHGDYRLQNRQLRMDSLFELRFRKLISLELAGIHVDLEAFKSFIESHPSLRTLSLTTTDFTTNELSVQHGYFLPKHLDTLRGRMANDMELDITFHSFSGTIYYEREIWIDLIESLRGSLVKHVNVQSCGWMTDPRYGDLVGYINGWAPRPSVLDIPDQPKRPPPVS